MGRFFVLIVVSVVLNGDLTSMVAVKRQWCVIFVVAIVVLVEKSLWYRVCDGVVREVDDTRCFVVVVVDI